MGIDGADGLGTWEKNSSSDGTSWNIGIPGILFNGQPFYIIIIPLRVSNCRVIEIIIKINYINNIL